MTCGALFTYYVRQIKINSVDNFEFDLIKKIDNLVTNTFICYDIFVISFVLNTCASFNAVLKGTQYELI